MGAKGICLRGPDGPGIRLRDLKPDSEAAQAETPFLTTHGDIVIKDRFGVNLGVFVFTGRALIDIAELPPGDLAGPPAEARGTTAGTTTAFHAHRSDIANGRHRGHRTRGLEIRSLVQRAGFS